MLLCLCYLIKEFNCNILYSNNVHSVRCRLLISNVPNCKPLRETEITEVDYLGRYQLGVNVKDRKRKQVYIFTGFPHSRWMFSISLPKKRDDNRFKRSRLLSLDCLSSCFKIQISAKKHKTVFGFISPRNTPWEIQQPMFLIYSYSYYRFFSYLLEDNWLICGLRPQCMIFNVRLCFL